ncbi:MAG: hypothetical protein E5Y00_05020, partial [Mesorhizobium sp.]
MCRFRAGAKSFQAGAASHLPAGILSPYSDGEREAPAADFANRQRLKRTPTPRPAPSPRPIRGE